ncbi:TolC family outer membrane protein [Falsihalocynthiibacter sp. SS001]|uniref:TolC family outer membrane protein n=1 Tax=Falsihalocynthiibacter sp. SS001 TaxID=3349698 RepID=UPI0036D2CB03
MIKSPSLLALFACVSFFPASVQALSLNETISYVLETNPDIKAAEANKQAIEFELQQARSFYAPRVELEAWAGASVDNGSTIPDLTAADDPISGYSLSGRITQMLFDGFETRSEVERQAYRIDSAAFRVLERSEVLSLEAIRTYSDVLRTQELLSLARQNLEYHRNVFNRIQSAYNSGIVGVGDLNQAQERMIQAEDIIIDFEYNLEDTKTMFLAVVGVAPTNLGTVPSIGSRIPATIDDALAIARQRNPTILFGQADVGASEALSRRIDSNRYPTLSLEADGRIGEDLGGFEGGVSDARIGLVLRYEFQGSSNRANRQEHLRRAAESRSTLLAQTRRVETEVRQSWSTLRAAQRRSNAIRAQSELSRKLRGIYEKEFEVGQRSLLDVLNTQASLFQSEANLVNAISAERYVKYRVLASIGILLPTLGIEPPEDARTYARQHEGVRDLNAKNDQRLYDASSFSAWRKTLE